MGALRQRSEGYRGKEASLRCLRVGGNDPDGLIDRPYSPAMSVESPSDQRLVIDWGRPGSFCVNCPANEMLAILCFGCSTLVSWKIQVSSLFFLIRRRSFGGTALDRSRLNAVKPSFALDINDGLTPVPAHVSQCDDRPCIESGRVGDASGDMRKDLWRQPVH